MTARGTPSRMMNGQHPALVLRGQHQVHEDQAQREDVDRPASPPCTSSSDCPAQAKSNPGGRASREICSMACEGLARAHARARPRR